MNFYLYTRTISILESLKYNTIEPGMSHKSLYAIDDNKTFLTTTFLIHIILGVTSKLIQKLH